jgi:hypothetical protein
MVARIGIWAEQCRFLIGSYKTIGKPQSSHLPSLVPLVQLARYVHSTQRREKHGPECGHTGLQRTATRQVFSGDDPGQVGSLSEMGERLLGFARIVNIKVTVSHYSEPFARKT